MSKVTIRCRNKLLIMFFFLAGTTTAQSFISSPYSSFGIGNVYNINNIRNLTMGGVSIGSRDYFTLNLNNPASFTAIDSTSFTFEAGIIGHRTTLKTTDFDESYTNGTLSHLLFGFPVTHWWKSSIGLLPYSGVGYSISDLDYHESIGNIHYNFNGNGGINRVFWGNGFRLADFLSVGLNVSYLFGSINKQVKTTFPDSVNMVNSLIDDMLTISDIYFEAGLQYHTTINNQVNLTIGATYNPKMDLNAKRNYLSRTYINEVNDVIIIQDTVLNISGQAGKVTLPGGYGIGITLNKSYDWLVGADYKFDKWSDYQSFGKKDSLVDSHTFRFGGSLIPDRNSLSYFRRIEYRVGGKYQLSSLNLRNEHLSSFGITVGTGLPLRGSTLRRSRSMINFGIEVGKRGTVAHGLIQENYLNVHLGISIYEWWFFKRRYN